MLVFCDESWKANPDGKRVGTLAAIAIPRTAYNELEDRVFLLANKYFGIENARKHEIKGKQLLSHYEYRRELEGVVSMKLSFARELLEEARARRLKVFASVIYSERDIDLLCEEEDRLDRAYMYLMERVNHFLQELDGEVRAALVFDDRGIKQNERVAEAYRNFLNRSKLGRSFANLLRSPFFAYSTHTTGIQLADLVCTVVNRYYTERGASPRIPDLFGVVRGMEWVARDQPAEYALRGIKVLGG